MAGMESNHIPSLDRADPLDLDRGATDELNALIAEIAERDPADAGEPAARLADLLGVMLEPEDDHR
jgi:hypothetical protein